MSQVSDAIKAKRKQHRQDHNTKADKALNKKFKGDRQGKNSAKREALASQGNQGVEDFNFDQHGKGHVSGKEVRALRKQGHSMEDIQKQVTANGGEIGGNAQKQFNNYNQRQDKIANRKAAKEKANGQPQQPPAAPPETGAPSAGQPSVETTIATHQEQNQNANQDNDINNEINGDNNNVNINQDNSIRQYGGVNKSFVYNGGSNGNNYDDTPVSMATMGGFFHDEDSPAKSASFVDRYSTMNSDNQKKYANPGVAQDSIDAAKNNVAFDWRELNQDINDDISATRARSTVMAGDIFGDMYNYKAPDYNMEKDDDEE